MEGKLQSWWPLPLRVLLGISFMVHGAPKIFDMAVHTGFAASLHQMGIPLAGLMAWVAGLVELFGGLALLVGLFTAEAAALLVIEMLVAMFKVHLAAGFAAINVIGTSPEGVPQFGLPGAELSLLYIVGLLALFIGGPGPLSIEQRTAPESRLRPPWLRQHPVHA